MSAMYVINLISSIASLILFIYLCFQVRASINTKSENNEKQDGEAKEFFDSSRAMIKDRSFRIKVFVLCGLIVVNIVTILIM